jgi:hypothetical protein
MQVEREGEREAEEKPFSSRARRVVIMECN